MKGCTSCYPSYQTGDAESYCSRWNGKYEYGTLLCCKDRTGYRMGDGKIIDSMIMDGLQYSIHDFHMGITAENVAEQYNISREAQDEFSAWSQQKTERAIKDGKFKE